MRERPILFSTPMVKAILEGRKTVTRRVVDISPELAPHVTKWGFSIFTPDGHISARTKQPTERGHRYGEKWIRLKYGKAGDGLWVRETWMRSPIAHMVRHEPFKYKASASQQFIDEWPGYWKPSIYMPKEACRLKLEILSIRVERLHDITEEDAIKEGIEEHWVDLTTPTMIRRNYLKGPDQTFEMDVSEKKSFETLWASINGQESWDSNPWVWRIEFKKL